MNLLAYYDREATSGWRAQVARVEDNAWLWACDRYMERTSDALCAAYNERRKR